MYKLSCSGRSLWNVKPDFVHSVTSSRGHNHHQQQQQSTTQNINDQRNAISISQILISPRKCPLSVRTNVDRLVYHDPRHLLAYFRVSWYYCTAFRLACDCNQVTLSYRSKISFKQQSTVSSFWTIFNRLDRNAEVNLRQKTWNSLRESRTNTSVGSIIRLWARERHVIPVQQRKFTVTVVVFTVAKLIINSSSFLFVHKKMYIKHINKTSEQDNKALRSALTAALSTIIATVKIKIN